LATYLLELEYDQGKSRCPGPPYHHGDFHRAILSTALKVLRETESTEFSLRELARRAGVSHNALYKHFAEKGELLAAISARGSTSWQSG
jgi:AcrR family transcriptional regulator